MTTMFGAATASANVAAMKSRANKIRQKGQRMERRNIGSSRGVVLGLRASKVPVPFKPVKRSGWRALAGCHRIFQAKLRIARKVGVTRDERGGVRDGKRCQVRVGR